MAGRPTGRGDAQAPAPGVPTGRDQARERFDDGLTATAPLSAVAPPESDTGRGRMRLFYLISLPVWAAATLRALSDVSSSQEDEPVGLAATLLIAFAALFAAERRLSRSFGWFTHPYFALQTGLVLALMLLLPELDYFPLLFFPLSAQALLVLPRRTAYRWIGVLTLVMATGLALTQVWPESLALILSYAGAYFFVAAYATAKEQAEAAREHSRALLADLQRAYQQLETYAARAERLAAVEERNRLARDLHDSVTQTLYGLTLSAEAATRRLAAGSAAEAAEQVRELRETALQAQREMRLLIYQLRPPLLEQEGLAGSLRARLGAVEGRAGLATSLAVEGDGRIPIAVEDELDRIAQEALTNAVKHARASRIAVRLRLHDGRAELDVADDGVGFDPAAPRTGAGLGLRGMEERAARLGGRLAVESSPGRGTRVTAEVPR